MMRSKRMGANADGPHGRRQDERGVTLIELLVVIGILAVLTAVAVGGWHAIEKRNRTEGAIEQIASAMALARIKARATGRDQVVEVDFKRDRFRTQAWAGMSWRPVQGVDLLAGTAACAPGAMTTGVKTFIFTPRGTVGVSPAGSYTIMARTKNGAYPACVVVNSITGRTRIVRP